MHQLFLPNRKTLSSYYQPLPIDLPAGGDPAWTVWSFNPLPPLTVLNLTRVMNFDAIFWAITGQSTGGSATTGVFLYIEQIHNGLHLPLINTSQPLQNSCGSGQKPMTIKPAWFVPAGDSIFLQVQSQDPTNNLNVQVVLFGNHVPAGWQIPGGKTLNGVRDYLRRRLSGMGDVSQPSLDPPNPYQSLVLSAKQTLSNTLQSPNTDSIGDQAPPGASPLVLGPILTPYPAPGGNPETLFTYTVPPGQRTRIFEHALQHVGGNPPELSGSGVTWSFTVNGAPLQGLGQQSAQIGSFATPDRVVIWLNENDTMQVTVNPGTAVQPGQSGYRVNGWTVPALSSGSGSGSS